MFKIYHNLKRVKKELIAPPFHPINVMSRELKNMSVFKAEYVEIGNEFFLLIFMVLYKETVREEISKITFFIYIFFLFIFLF